MFTNLQTAAIMIVFAGGPNTPERTGRACELLASQPPPASIYLTGSEYRGLYSNLMERVISKAAILPNRPGVFTDTCPSTYESCRYLARDISVNHPEGANIMVVTSDYHALRARWLMTGVFPDRYPVTFFTIPDIPWRESFSSPRNRQLIFREWFSWVYCLPLGLIFHPLPLSLAIVLIIGIVFWRKSLLSPFFNFYGGTGSVPPDGPKPINSLTE